MTPRQQQLLAYLRSRAGDEVQPSLVEMAAALGLASKSNIHPFLIELERQGYIERDPRRPRSLRLIDQALGHLSTAAMIDELAKRDLVVISREAFALGCDAPAVGVA